MSSTGLKNSSFDYIETENIDVNEILKIQDIDILELINNDITNINNNIDSKISDLSDNLIQKINDLSNNLYDLSNNLYDLSDNLYDLSNNLYDLSNNLYDLSDNVTKLKLNDEVQDSNISSLEATVTEHTTQIAANTTQIEANTAQIELNTAAIASTSATLTSTTATLTALTLTVGAASTLESTASGIFSLIDNIKGEKLNKSAFASGNVGIYSIPLFGEYINVVHNDDHFEDITIFGVNNRVMSLKEPYKSLPTTKENVLTFNSPLTRNNNSISIDLSGYYTKNYIDTSLNAINTTLTNKQNNLTVTTPLIKDTSNNNISIDLSGYAIKSNVDTSLNAINSSLLNKQNIITVTTPLIKDISDNLSIDLSAYPLKTYVDGSLNTILTTKQNNLTFNNPLLLTSNMISFKYNTTQFKIDTSGNLAFYSNYWDTSGSMIFYNTGNVGIGTTNPQSALDISGNVDINGICDALILNACDSNVISSVKSRNLNIIGTSAVQRIFRYGATTNAPSVELMWNLTAPTTSTDYTYLWDFSIDPSTGSFNIRCRKPDAGINHLVIKPGGYIGIGTTNPSTSYKLDVSGNINCSGSFSGSGSGLTALNASNISSGTLSISRGGIGTTTLTANQILIGNGTSALLQSSNLTWNNTSNTLSATNFIGSGAGLTALNASNITSGTLTVTQGGTGSTTLTSGQILIGNGTSALYQTPNLIWDSSKNRMGIGTTQFVNNNTSFQVGPTDNRRIWCTTDASGYSLTLLSTEKYTTATSENYIQLMENVGMTFRTNPNGSMAFAVASDVITNINGSGLTVVQGTLTTPSLTTPIITTTTLTSLNLTSTNIFTGSLTVNSELYGANSTAKSLIKFQTRYNFSSGLYYYNLQINKYYNTGQTINGNNYKVFSLTSWAEDFSLINKCTVFITSQGAKYIMSADNWGIYLPNGNQSGWQRDTDINYMSFLTVTQKNIITILENLL